MAVQVIIRRTFNDEEKARKLAPCIVQLRSRASVQPGYISGETTEYRLYESLVGGIIPKFDAK